MRHYAGNIIFALLVLLIPVCANSQQTFQKAFYKTQLEDYTVKKIIATNDGGALVLSQIGSGQFAAQILMKLDSDFEPEWTKDFWAGFEQYIIIHDILQADDNTFVLTGTHGHVGDMQFFIYGLDKNGDRKWGTQSGIWQKLEEGKILRLHNNYIYVAGQSRSSTAVPNELFVTRFSLDGDIDKEYFWFEPFEMELVDMQIAQTGEIYLAAKETTGINPDPFLIKVDKDMVAEYTERIELPGINYAEGLVLTDNHVIICGTDNSNVNGRFFATIIPIPMPSNNFNTFYFDFGEDVNLHDVILNQSSGLILSGEINGTSDKGCINMRVNFDEVNRTFTEQWVIEYGDDEEQSFSSIDINKNNFIISAGTSLGFVNNAYSIYVSKSFSTGFTGCKEKERTVNINSISHPHKRTNVSMGTGSLAASVAVFYTLNDQEIDFQNACDIAPPNSDFGFKDTLCEDSCITISNMSTFADSFFWTFNGTTIDDFNGENPPNLCYSTPGNYSITLITANALGRDTTTKTITINPTPDIKAPNDTTICEGSIFHLEGQGGATYEWTGFSANDSILPNDNVIPAAANTYYVTGTSAEGCIAYDSVRIGVMFKPTPVGFDSVICLDSTIFLNARNNGFNYAWSTGSGSQQIEVTDSNNYTVTVSNDCFSEVYSFKIETVDCTPTIFIPTAFKPDNDGVNDVFYIAGNNITVYEFEIFNRWGEKIFVGSEDNNFAWDGTYNGIPVPTGLYIYQAKIQIHRGKRSQVKGTVYLIK